MYNEVVNNLKSKLIRDFELLDLFGNSQENIPTKEIPYRWKATEQYNVDYLAYIMIDIIGKSKARDDLDLQRKYFYGEFSKAIMSRIERDALEYRNKK